MAEVAHVRIDAATDRRLHPRARLQHGLPYETVRRYWANYQAVTAAGDETALAIACGDADGRRENARRFSRAEKELLREAIDKENIDPNKPVLQRLALAVHTAHARASTPADSTVRRLPLHRSPPPPASSNASSATCTSAARSRRSRSATRRERRPSRMRRGSARPSSSSTASTGPCCVTEQPWPSTLMRSRARLSLLLHPRASGALLASHPTHPTRRSSP